MLRNYLHFQGSEVFKLTPPSDDAWIKFFDWATSENLTEVFLEHILERNLYKVTLTARHNFFLPGGWIHSVYTPEDSIVFGRNFFHNFAIDSQIR